MIGHTITPAQYHGSGSPRPQQYSLWLLFWSDFQFNFISRWIALGFQFNFEMIFTLIMQLLLLLNLLATSFYFQSFFFLCFAVTFHFTFSFDLFFLLFFIKSLKNFKILSGGPRPPYITKLFSFWCKAKFINVIIITIIVFLVTIMVRFQRHKLDSFCV